MRKFFSVLLALAVIAAMAVSVSAASTKITTVPGSQQVVIPKADSPKNSELKMIDSQNAKTSAKPGASGTKAAVDASSVGADSSKNTDFVHVPVDFQFFGPVGLSDVGSDNVTYKGNPYIFVKGADVDVDVNVNVLANQVKN